MTANAQVSYITYGQEWPQRYANGAAGRVTDAPSGRCPTARFGIWASPAMTRIARQASHFGVRKNPAVLTI